MASTYGYNFGFRVSNESYRSGNVGDFKVPETGTFFQGDVVEIDKANPGYLAKAAADAPILPGVRGLLVQEEGFIFGEHVNQTLSTMDLAAVYNGRRASIWTGAGLVVWYKNTPAYTRQGARSRDAVTKLTGALAVGDVVAWDGSKFAKTADETKGIGRVTEVNDDGSYAELTLLR